VLFAADFAALYASARERGLRCNARRPRDKTAAEAISRLNDAVTDNEAETRAGY
jgi:hypothetical protein